MYTGLYIFNKTANRIGSAGSWGKQKIVFTKQTQIERSDLYQRHLSEQYLQSRHENNTKQTHYSRPWIRYYTWYSEPNSLNYK